MVAPAFGFSVGDFVAAIQLTVKIGKALRDTNGAASEYRLVQQDLQSLRLILEHIQALTPNDANAGHIKALQGMSLTCLVPLREFADKLDRCYNSTLRADSNRNVFCRGGRKAQWAALTTEEVSKFRAVMSAKVASIFLLLGTCTSESLARLETQTQRVEDALQSQAAENHQHLDNKLTRLNSLNNSRNTDLLTKIHQNRQSLRADVSDLDRRAETRHAELLAKQREAGNALDHRLKDVRDDAALNLKELVEISCGVKTSNQRVLKAISDRSGHVRTQLASIKADQGNMRAETSFGFRSTLRELRMIRRVGERLFEDIFSFSEALLDCLRKTVSTNMDIYALLLKIQASMPQRIESPSQDAIHFQDVLGRTKDLPYIYFHHWTVFEAMLRCDFEGVPGEQKVLNGDYVLMNGLIQGLEIDKDAWEQLVFPGSQVSMSVIIKALCAENAAVCLRAGCSGAPINTSGGPVLRCSLCGLVFIPESSRTIQMESNPHQGPLSKGRRLHRTAQRRLLESKVKAQEHQLPNRVDLQHLRGHQKAIKQQQFQSERNELMVFRAVHLRKASHTASVEMLAIIKAYDKEVLRVMNFVISILGDKFASSTESFEPVYRIIYRAFLNHPTRARQLLHAVFVAFENYVEHIFKAELEDILYRPASLRRRDGDVIAFLAGFWSDFEVKLKLISEVFMYPERVEGWSQWDDLTLVDLGHLIICKNLETIENGVVLRILEGATELAGDPSWKEHLLVCEDMLATLYAVDEFSPGSTGDKMGQLQRLERSVALSLAGKLQVRPG